MAYLGEGIDANLALVSGDDAALFLELRAAFIESAAQQLDLMRRSRCDGNWQIAAMRLKGLAASFHAEQLIVLAEEALEAAPGEPGILRRIERFITDLSSDRD
ncbi:Hpt domain-containing protein [Novosphingobium sp. ZN18A2]|uniref:Hpt domain-containing protein n=1 Tax=Novosphingobium sp. ZN18A2 TaxID=3079861 RepID=UPI0030D212BB